MMKLCFTITSGKTKEQILSYEKVFEMGLYQGIEIFYPYDQGQTQLKEYTEAIHYLLDKYPNLELVLHEPHGPYNGLSEKRHLESGSLEIAMAGAKFASQFGVKKLTTHLGHIDGNKNPEARKAAVKVNIENVQKLCDYAKQFGQYVMIENMPFDSEMGYSPDELLEVIEGVNRENCKFILDTGHANCSIYTEDDYLNKLGKYLYHIHTHDNDGTKDQHRPIFYGNIDWDHHFEQLHKLGYHEIHCLEIIYQGVDDLIKNVPDFRKYEHLFK